MEFDVELDKECKFFFFGKENINFQEVEKEFEEKEEKEEKEFEF